MLGTYAIEFGLKKEETEFLKSLVEALRYSSDSDIQRMFLVDEKKGNMIAELREMLSSFGIVLMPHEVDVVLPKVKRFVEKYFQNPSENLVKEATLLLFSLGKLSRFFEDPRIEEIMVNGPGKPVFVVHRDKGMCSTNVRIDHEELDWTVSRIMRAARIQPQEKPIYDGSLPDGSRVNIILPPVSQGASITIRRFSPQPFTIVDLIKNGTMSSEMAAFLWLAVEGMGIMPANILISGGSSSGKTTTLNALIGFIPRDQRVISIEDTPELNPMHRDNWVSLYTSYDYKKGIEVTMYDLVKASLRMRPDRLIVGEVRGREAQEMFVAMDVGCSGTMGTIHANSSKETVSRLVSPPMNVPEALIPLVDIILVQQRVRIPGKGVVRRVTEISEVGRIDKVGTRVLYRWDMEKDRFLSPEIPPSFLDELSEVSGMDKPSLMAEIQKRKRILDELVESGVSGYDQVYKRLQKMLSLSDDTFLQ